jgi:REase_DpnII-MboI
MHTTWTKESALQELDRLVGGIEKLKAGTAYSAEHVRWDQGVVAFLEEVFGRQSRAFVSFGQLTWRHRGQMIIGGVNDPEGTFNPQAAIEREHHKAYLKQLEAARGLLLAARDELERKGLDGVYQGKDTGPEASVVLKVINLAERKLRKAIRNTPADEGEVQDAFENLLIGADIPYSRETEHIEYSSKTYVPDFSFAKADLVTEIKICNTEKREKEIIAEINDDILAYSTKYGNMIFVVYDKGFIRDVERFATHFENNDGVVVRVVKH